MDDSRHTAGGAGRTTLPRRTLVIGLSGASWNVLEPLLLTGELPSLARMRETGASGTLESVIPFQPAPAWASYATGALPGTHGCYDLVAPDRDGRMRTLGAGDLRVPTYYELLGRAGRRSVLVNLPIDQRGCEGAVIVNSWLTTDEARRILPVGRRERYRRLLNAQRVLPTNAHDLDEICAVDVALFDLVRELFLHEEWDHFFVLFSASDWLGHTATGRFLSGDDDARQAFLRLYRQLDAHVGWLLDHAGDATAIVLSEHGQAEERAILRINTVLEVLGLTETLPPATGDAEARGRFGRARLAVAHNLLGGQAPACSAARIDTRRSRAFSPTDASFAVYVRDRARLDMVVDALSAVALADGSRAIETVWRTEELWGRPPRPDEPALLFEPALGVRPSAAVKDRAVDRPARSGLGCHRRDGVLMISGPAVASGRLGATSICDLAPTLLWLMDVPLRARTDGHVVIEAFDKGCAASRPIRFTSADGSRQLPIAPDGDHDRVTRRLRALGYI